MNVEIVFQQNGIHHEGNIYRFSTVSEVQFFFNESERHKIRQNSSVDEKDLWFLCAV